MLVRYLNCGILWRRVTDYDNPSGTVPTVDIQYTCPNCNSNAFEWAQPVFVPLVWIEPFEGPTTTPVSTTDFNTKGWIYTES